MTYTIYWDNYFNTVQIHGGTTVTVRAKDHVIFENNRMAPGLVMKEWRSLYQFQEHKQVNVLPLLQEKRWYVCHRDIQTQPERTVYVRIVFYNQQREEIGTTVLKHDTEVFQCPTRTHSYTLQLINAGCDRLVFRQMKLIPLALDDTTQQPSDAIATIKQTLETTEQPCTISFHAENVESDVLRLVFVEPSHQEGDVISSLKELENVVLVSHSGLYAQLYLDGDTLTRVRKYVTTLLEKNQYKQVHIIGYGSVSNFAALSYATYFKNVTVYISRLLYPMDFYKKIIAEHENMISVDVAYVLKQRDRKNTVIYEPMYTNEAHIRTLQHFIVPNHVLAHLSQKYKVRNHEETV